MMENEQLEDIKLSIYNNQQFIDMKNNPATKAALSLIKSIPVIGELLDSGIDMSLQNFQENKKQQLIAFILNNPMKITSTQVNDVEFIMNFYRTAETVCNLAANDKIEYFGNLVRNGYLTDEKIENSFFEECLLSLNLLSYRQISILIELYNFEKIYVMQEIVEKDNELMPRMQNWDKFVEIVIQKGYASSEEELLGVLQSISKTGFCKEIVGAYFDYSGGIFAITEYCKRFIEMILGDNDE